MFGKDLSYTRLYTNVRSDNNIKLRFPVIIFSKVH